MEPPAHSAGQVTDTPTQRAAWTATCLATLLLTTGLGMGLPQRSGFDVQGLFLIPIVGGFATIGQLIARYNRARVPAPIPVLSPFRPAYDRIRAVVDETLLPQDVSLCTRPVRGAER